MRSLRDVSLLAEHQLSAVERLTSLLATYGGAILADEPGLGKSYVAAEVARREQGRVKIEAIVPAALVEQWEETFRRFHVAADVMTHTALLSAESEAASSRLLIVDEAHAFRNPATQRFVALAKRSVGAKLLLVTATPVCNGPRDLESLLRLIATDDALISRGVPSIDVAFERRDHETIAAIVAELVVRRDRAVLPSHLAFGDIERRVIWTHVDGRIAEMIDAVRFPLLSGLPLVRDFLQRRLESSEAALLESLRRQRRFYERALECLAAGRALPKREYRRAFAHEEDATAFQTILFWELFVPDSDAVDAAEIHAAVHQLDELRTAVERLPREKERALIDLCIATDEPLLIFTGWTATARTLAAALAPLRSTVLMTGRERGNSAAVEAFRRGAAAVLVSTDIGAEGLNLQRAGFVIHYDLPWNPMRIDQRNGRALRIGQTRDIVRAIYFLPERHRGRVLPKIVQKNRTRRQLLAARAAIPARAATTIRPRVVSGARARQRAGLELLLQSFEGDARDLERLLALESRVRAPIIGSWIS